MSFESAFSANIPNIEKDFIIQIENSVISENPIDSFKTNKGSVIISTPQKIIDFSINTDCKNIIQANYKITSNNTQLKEHTKKAWTFRYPRFAVFGVTSTKE